MGDGAESGNRRVHDRVETDLPVVEIVGDTTYFQYAVNLSEGGLYLSRTLSHPPGTHVLVLFRVPGHGEPITLEAEVVGDRSERGMRLRFVDLDERPDAREKVRRLIAKFR
jgi:hypothetical protein